MIVLGAVAPTKATVFRVYGEIASVVKERLLADCDVVTRIASAPAQQPHADRW
jgi:hypothetical protein